MDLPNLIIDFDSTFVTLESLDELARIATAGRPDRSEVMQKLSNVTDMGMEGKIGFAESLELRLAMFQASQQHVDQLISMLREHITPSVLRNRDFFQRNSDRIYIISGGFSDYIVPIVMDYGLLASHVLANRFEFDAAGNIVGHDKSCPLAQDNGKVIQLASMLLKRPIYVVGDGYTDYKIKAAGQAEKFFAFTENVQRSSVIEVADEVWTSFDQLVALGN